MIVCRRLANSCPLVAELSGLVPSGFNLEGVLQPGSPKPARRR